jgi:hypothetical protein
MAREIFHDGFKEDPKLLVWYDQATTLMGVSTEREPQLEAISIGQ